MIGSVDSTGRTNGITPLAISIKEADKVANSIDTDMTGQSVLCLALLAQPYPSKKLMRKPAFCIYKNKDADQLH